jgi:DNA-directed RNA polymerase subunit E'/Rpb7
MAAVQVRKPPAKNEPTEFGVYVRNMISMKVFLKMREVGKNTKGNLERKVVEKTEGKCIPEGFIRPDSVHILSYSSGVVNLENIEFQVVFECLVCNPVEGMHVDCLVKTITKAGIHGEVVTEKGYVPLKIFVARDHNYLNRLFGQVKEGATVKAKIIGKRFELNDPYIVAIASLVDLGKERRQAPQKPKIVILNKPDESAESDEDLDDVVEELDKAEAAAEDEPRELEEGEIEEG